MKQSDIEDMVNNEKILRKKIMSVFKRECKTVVVEPSRTIINGNHRIHFKIHTDKEWLKGTL